MDGQPGILSALSSNGLDFATEQSVRVPYQDGVLTANGHPTRTAAGRYLMSYNVHPGSSLELEEAHLATSADGFTWVASPAVVALGGMPGVVETADGTLYMYYVDFDYARCQPDATTLCLEGWRFRVQAHWRTAAGTAGEARAVQLSADTGTFWFFAGTNVEVILKVLNACVSPFDRYWVFASGLTNVEVEITVTDTKTGTEKVYWNPLGTSFRPILDTNAFSTCP